jgi:hypothetical protein
MLLLSYRPALLIAQNGAKQRPVKATTSLWLRAENREVHHVTDQEDQPQPTLSFTSFVGIKARIFGLTFRSTSEENCVQENAAQGTFERSVRRTRIGRKPRRGGKRKEKQDLKTIPDRPSNVYNHAIITSDLSICPFRTITVYQVKLSS